MLSSWIIGTLLCLGLWPAAQAASPAVGTMAPAFRLQDQNGAWHSLADYQGKWLVMYFYPKDGTPGCTAQACELRDNIFAFKKIGAAIVGLSVDDVASHKGFAEQHSLPFPVLADSSKETAKHYGVLVKMFGLFEIAQRDTFIIDPQGHIAQHLVNVEPKGHSAAVLKELATLQSAAAEQKP